MDHAPETSLRLQRLRRLAQHVRQIAISGPGDLSAWKVARLLNEATSPAESDEAERQYERWIFRSVKSPAETGLQRARS